MPFNFSVARKLHRKSGKHSKSTSTSSEGHDHNCTVSSSGDGDESASRLTSRLSSSGGLPTRSIGWPDPGKVHTNTSLLGCPAEVRNVIYSFLIAEPSTTDRLKELQRDGPLNEAATVLLTCRQIYHEFRTLAFHTVLVVPEKRIFPAKRSIYYHPVETTRYQGFPLRDSRLGRIAPTELENRRIRHLVVREYAHYFRFHSSQYSHDEYPWPTNPFATSLKLNRLHTIWLQLCICDVASSEFNHAATIIPFLPLIRTAVYQSVFAVDSLSRIVIYFCGLTGNNKYSNGEAAALRKKIKSSLATPEFCGLGPWVRCERKTSTGVEVIEDMEDDDRKNQFRSITGDEVSNEDEAGAPEYYLTFLKGHWGSEKRTVTVQLFDSHTVCNKRCVLV